jgi:hypothetical protein
VSDVPTDSEIYTKLGQHDAQIEALGTTVNRLHADMSSIIRELRDINATLHRAQGSWRTLVIVATVASAGTALVLKLAGVIVA